MVDNLIKNSNLTPNERRQKAKRGGIQSGKSRRYKKTMRILLSEALELPISSKDKMFFEKMGMDSQEIDELTQKALIQIGLINKAKKGDAGAYKLIADILGEKK